MALPAVVLSAVTLLGVASRAEAQVRAAAVPREVELSPEQVPTGVQAPGEARFVKHILP
jgi:hypothetical protein